MILRRCMCGGYRIEAPVMRLCSRCGFGSAGPWLTRTERALVWRIILAGDGFAENDELVWWLYAERLDGGPLTASSCVNVHIARIRSKLAPHGWAITTVGVRRGALGWRLERLADVRGRAA